jgi:hypothetical protein
VKKIGGSVSYFILFYFSSTGTGGDVMAATRKKVYRQLVLRWHPDKFEVSHLSR